MPIINSMIFGGGGSDDPFEWRSVEIIPVCNANEDDIVLSSYSYQCVLPVAIDFSKYTYDFIVISYGLQESGNTSTKYKTHYLSLADENSANNTGWFLDMYASASQSENSDGEEINYVDVTTAIIYTTTDGDFKCEKTGFIKGTLESHYKTSGSLGFSTDRSYKTVCADFDSTYELRSRGLVFSYKAHAAV